MQLVKIDPLEFQSLETFIDALCQVLRPPVLHPLSRTGPGVTAFRRDHQSFRIRIQRLGNEELVRFRTVSIRGIDEIDAQFDRAPQNFLSVLTIRWPTPDPLARHPHRPTPTRLTNRSPPNKNVSSLLLVLAAARSSRNPSVKTPAAPAE